MRWLDLTLPSAAENLALDEALLLAAEASGEPAEVLRVWEPAETFVVLGRSSRRAEEVDLAACRQLGIGVYRRCSGGASVVTGPGCLMYAVVLSCTARPSLRGIAAAHEHVLSHLVAALRPHCPQVTAAGTSDLALAGRKVSGNSLRCLRDHVLYHGTLLYDFPLERIGRCLKSPPRQPDYRAGRSHGDFVTNLPLSRDQIRQALLAAWNASESLETWPQDEVQRLAREKYTTAAWNEKL